MRPIPNVLPAKPNSKHSGFMVFLRGYPSAEWLNHLGAAFDIDPELFYRHLGFLLTSGSNKSQPQYSSSTPFPQSADLIQLRVCNTGSWQLSNPKQTLGSLRKICDDSMKLYLEDLMRSHDTTVGDSIVRRFMLPHLHSFSIEQKISIEVIYHTRTWSSK